MSERMPKADQVRLWNARRGVARAAEQITGAMQQHFDWLSPAEGWFGPLMDNFNGALEELHAAEKLIRAPFAIELDPIEQIHP